MSPGTSKMLSLRDTYLSKKNEIPKLSGPLVHFSYSYFFILFPSYFFIFPSYFVIFPSYFLYKVTKKNLDISSFPISGTWKIRNASSLGSWNSHGRRWGVTDRNHGTRESFQLRATFIEWDRNFDIWAVLMISFHNIEATFEILRLKTCFVHFLINVYIKAWRPYLEGMKFSYF